MRAQRLSAPAGLGASAALFVVGCNAIFGLDPVQQRDAVDAGTGGSSTSTGAGGACPAGAVAGNLIKNPSFEQSSDWSTEGQGAMFSTLPADDCSFACGSRIGHLAIAGSAQPDTISVFQDVSTPVELGGQLVLSAHYRSAGAKPPYFDLVANGFDVQTSGLDGVNEGSHLVIDKAKVSVLDPRRAGNGVRLRMQADYAAAGVSADLDCVSLTYTKPPGVQALQNGWFDGSVDTWFADNSATMVWDAQGGLCSSGAAHVTVSKGPGADSAEIRSNDAGPWPKGTKFYFGAAVKPLQAMGAPGSLNYTLTLFIEYQTADGGPGVSDVFQVSAGADDGEGWLPLVGEFDSAQAVETVQLRIGGSYQGTPGEFLADCASLRAVVPP